MIPYIIASRALSYAYPNIGKDVNLFVLDRLPDSVLGQEIHSSTKELVRDVALIAFASLAAWAVFPTFALGQSAVLLAQALFLCRTALSAETLSFGESLTASFVWGSSSFCLSFVCGDPILVQTTAVVVTYAYQKFFGFKPRD